MKINQNLLAALSALLLMAGMFHEAGALAMRDTPTTWHMKHAWEGKTNPALTLTAHQQQIEKETFEKYVFIKNELAGLKAVSAIPNIQCITTNLSCSTSLGFVVVNDFPGHTGGGTVGSGNGDDEPVMLNAATAACNSGAKLVRFNPGKYNIQTQFNSPCDGLVFFCSSENISYDPEGHPNASCLVYGNTGFFSSANHLMYNYNGKTDNVWWSINIGGDGGGNGYSAFGTSFNYTGSGQIPRAYIFDSGIGGFGTAFGCGIKSSGVASGFAQQYTGTGATCGNYMGYRIFNVNASENYLAANGNITDMFWKGGTISGNGCGGIVGANTGSEGMVLMPDTVEENGGGRYSGICPQSGPGIEETGPVWEIDSRFQGNQGVAVYFDDTCAASTVRGTFAGDGLAGTQGSRSEFAFAATCGTGITIDAMGGGSGFNGLVAPPYVFENIIGSSVINVIGGNMDSTQYATGFLNTVAGSLTFSELLTQGQLPSFANSLQYTFQLNGGSSTAACLNLNPTDNTNDHSAGFCASGSGNEAGSQWDYMTDSNSGANLYAWQFSKFVWGANMAVGWNSSNDALANSAAADTTISRSGAAMIATNGAVVNKGTTFTTSSGNTTVGGATCGHFLSATTGTLTAVITFNGATGITAPHGWNCGDVADQTTIPALFTGLMHQTGADSTTTCTITGTTVSGDQINFCGAPF